MALTPAKRKKMEQLIYGTMDKLDPSGVNSEKYRTKFKKMSNPEFEKYFKNIFSDSNDHLVVDVVDYERDLKLEHIEDAAKYLGVPLFERVVMPFINKDTGHPVVSQFDVPVGYANLKRMQQTLFKKNTTSTDISTRSALTGQVTGKDKNARDSDTENFALVTLEADNTLREFLGPRADDMVMKNELYADINRKGFANLEGLPNDLDNKTTLNAVDIRYTGMGIKTNLVTNGMVLKKTLNEKSK